jgi:hypothetical protein
MVCDEICNTIYYLSLDPNILKSNSNYK